MRYLNLGLCPHSNRLISYHIQNTELHTLFWASFLLVIFIHYGVDLKYLWPTSSKNERKQNITPNKQYRWRMISWAILSIPSFNISSVADHYQASMTRVLGQFKKKLTCVERNYCLRANKAMKLFTLSTVKAGLKAFYCSKETFLTGLSLFINLHWVCSLSTLVSKIPWH